VLRAAVNLGNPVLAQGTPNAPTGVTVDIARELGTRLGVPVEFVCFDAARKSFAAMMGGEADICFLAVEPERAAEVAFTAPYVIIEGVYAVPVGSPLTTVAEVDRAGVRIGVKEGSAYDLHLSRTLHHATVVRGDEGVDVFRANGLEVAAGIRQPLAKAVSADPGLRLIDGAFMQIRQAVGTRVDRRPETIAFLDGVIGELKANGFLAAALRRSSQPEDLVAPR
jgi:polar amino acid transport system substrate-binding protein